MLLISVGHVFLELQFLELSYSKSKQMYHSRQKCEVKTVGVCLKTWHNRIVPGYLPQPREASSIPGLNRWVLAADTVGGEGPPNNHINNECQGMDRYALLTTVNEASRYSWLI